LNDSNEDTTPRGWVTPTESLTIANFNESNDWIVVNNQETGEFKTDRPNRIYKFLWQDFTELTTIPLSGKVWRQL